MQKEGPCNKRKIPFQTLKRMKKQDSYSNGLDSALKFSSLFAPSATGICTKMGSFLEQK